MMRVPFRLGSLVFAVALLGCSSARPPHPNEVHLALATDPTSMSLIGNVDLGSSQIAALISDGLVGYDVHGEFVPLIARSWEISPDGRTITFKLRDGARWHDGAAVTSRDVAYTIRKIQDPATQSRVWASDLSDVTSVETPDDQTVIAHYADAYADALNGWRAPLVPEHLASKDPEFLNGAFAQSPTGCGPFRFVSRTAGQSIVLSAFDGYWGGRPPLDKIVFHVLANERTGYEALLLGDLDMLAVTPGLWRESLTSGRASRLARFVYYRLLGWKIDWNMDGSNPFFGDPRVRRALVMALDRQRFAATIANGLARPAVGSYMPESPWANRALTPLAYDPIAAGRLLDEAGWVLPPGGEVRMKNGVAFDFVLFTAAGAQEFTERISAWTQQSLRDIGVTMRIERLDAKSFSLRRKSHSFQAVMASNSFDPVADQFSIYHSTARTNGMNYGGFADPEVDRLVDQGRVTIDPAARRAIYDRLQVRLQELQPISYIFQFAQPVLHDPDLLGLTPSPMGFYLFTPGPRAWHWAAPGSRP
jgi:peptide/nickel transport system substrate-binding protein